MARMSGLQRATVLVGVFAMSACSAGNGVTASVMDGLEPDAVAGLHAESAGLSAVEPVADNGIESLIMMSIPGDEDGLLGAGCAAEPDEPLPDGDWFGFVLEAHKHHLVVDLACVYGPDTDQFQAYAADSDAMWSSHVVVNDVIAERSLRFGSDAQAFMAADNWQPRAVRTVVEEARTHPESGPRGVWLRVEDGRVVTVVQPYTMGVAAE